MANYTKLTDFAAKDALPSGNAAKIVKGTEIDDEFASIETAVNSKANSSSPALTGTPTAPTAVAGTNTTQIATTAFTKTLVDTEINTLNTALSTDITTVSADVATLTTTVAAKAPLASPAFTGTPTAPTQAYGTDTTSLATTAFVQDALKAVYPVGSVYINGSSTTNPATLLGFGTWVAIGAGRVLVGQDTGDASFNSMGETGGSKNAIVVSHTHSATSSVSDPGHNHGMTYGANPDTFSSTVNFPTDGGGANDQPTSQWKGTTGISVSTSIGSTGSSGTNANLQPYLVVKMWQRTA